jgi:hypothetical protein
LHYFYESGVLHLTKKGKETLFVFLFLVPFINVMGGLLGQYSNPRKILQDFI